MATKRTPGSHPGLIHCDVCGEDYAAAYRRCPFCEDYNDYDEDYDEDDEYEDFAGIPVRSGRGKRLAPKRRGGGYSRVSPLRVITGILSLAVILIAIWVVIFKLIPTVHNSTIHSPEPEVSVAPSLPPENSPEITPEPTPEVTPEVTPEPTPEVSPEVTPEVTPAPGLNNATSFTLNRSEFSMNDEYPNPVKLKVTFEPEGAEGTLTWTSSDPEVATVDENGRVSHGTKRGTAIITATLPNGYSQTCKVYNRVTGD